MLSLGLRLTGPAVTARPGGPLSLITPATVIGPVTVIKGA